MDQTVFSFSNSSSGGWLKDNKILTKFVGIGLLKFLASRCQGAVSCICTPGGEANTDCLECD